MLTQKELDQIRAELDDCHKPLFLFDDDTDGFCSYLLLYRYKQEGRGIIVKSAPMVDVKFIRKVEEYGPDKVFILDMPMVKPEFLEQVKVPIVWIDHHDPQNPKGNVKYFNPRKNKADSYQPTSTMCYLATKKDLWIGMVGSVADWHLPEFKDEFIDQFPGFLDKKVKRPDVALFDSKLGELIKVVSFNLKGKLTDVKKIMKAMTKIDHPLDILEERTPDGRYVMKRFKKLNEEYNRLLEAAKATLQGAKRVGVFSYTENDTSFTSDLSTELSYHFPKKIVVVCRHKDQWMKCSLRSRDVKLPALINKCLEGLEGHGGGHEYACGLVVRHDQFDTFIERLEENA